MTTDELAAKIKAKYPDYASMDNQQLVDKITTKYPDYKAQLAPNPSAPTPVMDTVQKTLELGGTVAGGMLGTAAGAITSPIDGPVGPIAGSVIGAGLGRAAGTSVSNVIRGFTNPSQNPSLTDQFKDVGQSAVQGAQDQATGEAVGAVAKPVVSSLGDAINNGLAKLSQWKLGASVPAKAAEIAKDSKFKLPDVSQEDIEAGVNNVQKALTEAKDKAGALLNDAKAKVGIPTTVAEREASLTNYGNPHGLGPDVVNDQTRAMLDSKSPEELAANIAQFKQLAKNGNSDPALTARVANALQDKINTFVDWQKGGDTVQGVLKQQYKDLGHIVADNAVGLQGAKGHMSEVLGVFDDLKGKLDSDVPGKAETFLRGLFTKDTPTNRAYLDKLAQLEQISGKPVLSNLFKQFTGEAFGKTMGSPKLASAAAMEAGTSLLHLNPLGTVAGAGYLAAQSPALIKAAGQANAGLSDAAIKATQSKLFKPGVIALKDTLDEPSRRALQSVKDRLGWSIKKVD